MKKTIFAVLFSALAALMLTGCGDDTDVSVSEGTGTLTYDGRNNALKYCTMVTSGPDGDGNYLHVISITSDNGKTSFTANIRKSSKDIPTGMINLKLTGSNTGSYRFESTNIIKGNAVGMLNITKNSESNYTIKFSHTSDPVSLNYTGGMSRKFGN